MAKIVFKQILSPSNTLFRVHAPRIAKKQKPGQFVILQINQSGERIVFTIVESDNTKGTVTFISQSIGKTTTELTRLNAGTELYAFLGPLGVPSHIEKFGTAAVVGGGVGIAEALPIARALKEAGNHIISIIGARTKELLICENEMRETSDELYVTTDDGSYKQKGLVTDVLNNLLEKKVPVAFVHAIGPIPMMRAVCEVTRPHNIKTMVSLNPIMVDGTGLCGGCRVTIDGKVRFACVDGPEFDGHKVDFKELTARNRMYLRQEKEAMERYVSKNNGDHECLIKNHKG